MTMAESGSHASVRVTLDSIEVDSCSYRPFNVHTVEVQPILRYLCA